jgi:hypothetical protein
MVDAAINTILKHNKISDTSPVSYEGCSHCGAKANEYHRDDCSTLKPKRKSVCIHCGAGEAELHSKSCIERAEREHRDRGAA